MVRAFHAELAWTGEGPLHHRLLIEVAGGVIERVTPGASAPAGAVRLPGLTIPGLANAHSHAFQRALRGRAQEGAGDFWAWRRLMYETAAAIDPETLFEVARAVYAEMAVAGVTAVGEFHYLHHPPGGGRYADPNETGLALLEAARQAGVALTLLDACYLRGGPDGRPPEGVQGRFSDGSAEAWAERVDRLSGLGGARLGAAVHSVRAVDEGSVRVVAEWARGRGVPLHFHLSEQPRENQDCLAATGLTPAALLERAGALGPGSTAVHATHVTADDVGLLGRAGAGVCLCPTTERDLGDGVGPAHRLAGAGCWLSVGSDSNAVVDLFEEMRAVELDQRLVTNHRGQHRPGDLLAAGTRGGMAALGRPSGGIAAGMPADLVTLRLDSPRLAGAPAASLPAQAVYAASAADVSHVVAGGVEIASMGRHLALGDVGSLLAAALGRLAARARR
ncbi:MAG: formimidoylglutamate deiminase [Candidatus Dormibacterales bacterium]